MDIAIIGGGISGLATAFYINRLLPEANVTVYEKEARVGGKAMTQSIDGFRIEEGVNGFLSSKPQTLEFVKESGNEARLQKSSDAARKRFIYHRDTLHPMPENPKSFFSSKLLSFGGKLRVAGELFVKPKKDETLETLYDFGCRRVGREFSDVFLDAMSAGIFGSTPQALCVEAAFPLVCELERGYGGLFKGMIKRKKKQAGPSGVLMSFNYGMSEFMESLEQNIRAVVMKDTTVEQIEKLPNGYKVQTKEGFKNYDRVVLSVEAFTAAQMIKGFDASLAESLLAVEYSPMAVVALGYDQFPHDLDGFGLLTTSASDVDILGVLWDSSVFKNRAPKGKKLLRVMIGGQRNKMLPKLSDAELIALAKEGIRKTMGIETEESVAFVKKWEQAIPNYNLGHIPLCEKIFAKLDEHKGLYLNSNAYYGVAFNDCIVNALKTAKAIKESCR